MANTRQDRAGEQTTKEKQAIALGYRKQGYNYTEIAQAMGCSIQYASKLVKRSLLEIIQEPAESVRDLELTRLDHLYKEAMKVLQLTHVYVQQGRIIMEKTVDPDTKEERFVKIEDTGPKLSAIDRLLKISERRARLLGLDTDKGEEKQANPEEFAARVISAIHAADQLSGGNGVRPQTEDAS